jgi:ubiquitin C-terminal hydrolase
MKLDNVINLTFVNQSGKEDEKEINNNNKNESFNVNKSQIITINGNNIIEENTKIILKNDSKNINIKKVPEFKYEIDLSKILAVGLVNLGNTCFMNSCLQCFYHCSEFTRELLKNYKYYDDKKTEILNAYLRTIKLLYDNGKNKNNNKNIVLIDKIDNKYANTSLNKKRYYYENKTEPVSANLFYKCLKRNFHLTSGEGSDPKVVAELILSQINKELNNNYIYRLDTNLKKTDEIALFNHIFSAYFKTQNSTVVSSFFYWIKEKVYICSECGNSTFNFQPNYILYFYPKTILKDFYFLFGGNKEDLSLEICFEYFHKSDELDNRSNSFTCKSCNKRTKAKSIFNYMATLPKYLVLCLYKDKDEENSIDINFSYGTEIDLKKFFKDFKVEKNVSTKYKFQGGCYSRYNDIHIVALCIHFDGLLYEFNDSYYRKYESPDSFKKVYDETPYLLIYRRSDI